MMMGVESSRSERLELLRKLRERVSVSAQRASSNFVATKWGTIDASLPDGGLSRRGVHEWIGVADGGVARKMWRPPLALMVYLAGRAQAATRTKRVVWIGSSVWPYPVAIAAQGQELLSHSLFVRTRQSAERLFAAELLLRSRNATALIMDGAGMDLTASRRLQYAAETGAALCMVVRPPWEADRLSAASTRWLVRTSAEAVLKQRWIVELLRCKGMQPNCSGAMPRWSLERNHATRDIVVVSDVGDGHRSTQVAERTVIAG
jgi:protein ImuA